MHKLSTAQTKLVARITAGGRLYFCQRTGLYVMQELGVEKSIDQRPVEALLLAGLLQRNLWGDCSLAVGEPDAPVVEFHEGQKVRWTQPSRRAEARIIDALVVSASEKQVRIRAVDGFEHVVRPGALRLVAQAS